MLLHVLVIVLFGNAPGVGARRGATWWGPLDVTLRRLAQRAAPPGVAPFGERGLAPQRSEAPAAKTRATEKTEPRPEPSPVEAERGSITQRPPIERIGPAEIEHELLPPLSVPLREEPLSPMAPLERIAPAGVEPKIVPPVELRPRELPRVPSVPIERLAPSQPERPMAPPVSIPPRELPRVPSVPIERLAQPQPERPMAPPVSIPPRELPHVPSAPVERLAPLPSERALSPPIVLPPRETPRLPAAPMERIAPGDFEQPKLAPPAVAPVAPPVPGVDRATAPTRSARPVPGPAPLEPPAQAPARPEVAPEEQLPNLWFAPRPDESMFKQRRDVVIPPTEPGELPHIDREAARQRAREIASTGGSRGVINLPLPVPPERKSKEAQAIEKAVRPDCRTEYAALGLLAVPALLANAITDTGCKW
jgi:hypothetical protein